MANEQNLDDLISTSETIRTNTIPDSNTAQLVGQLLKDLLQLFGSELKSQNTSLSSLAQKISALVVDSLTSSATDKALSAAKGKELNERMSSFMKFPNVNQWNANMDQCLEPGVYPWCTSGRPAGSTGAFTLLVKRTVDTDNNDYYVIEQTAYGREAELGQVWKRIIFYRADGKDTGFNAWRRIDNQDSVLYRIPGSFSAIKEGGEHDPDAAIQLGDANALQNAIERGDIIADDSSLVTLVSKSKENDYRILVNSVVQVYLIRIWFNGSGGYAFVSRSLIYTVEDNLASSSSINSLSANQGRVLNEKISALTKITTLPGNITNLNSVDDVESVLGTSSFLDLADTFAKSVVIDKSGTVIMGNFIRNNGFCYLTYAFGSRFFKKTLRAGNILHIDTYVGMTSIELDVEDGLESTNAYKPLSANQGRVLKNYINSKVINITDPDDGLCQSILSDFSHAIPGIFGHDVDTLFANLASGAVYVYNGVPLSISSSDGEGTMSIFFTYKGNMYFHDYFYSAGRGGMSVTPLINLFPSLNIEEYHEQEEL